MGTAAGTVWQLRGGVLIDPDEERAEVWVIDGRITFDRPQFSGEVTTVDGWVLPGLVDAHSHVGLVSTGQADRETAEQQAIADRDAGALLIRDAGSTTDTHWMDERDDLPRIIRAGRHIARSKRYLPHIGREIEPADLVAVVREEAARGDGWVKLVADWIDRDLGDIAPCWPRDVLTQAVAAAHEVGVRVTAHCFGEEALDDLAAAGVDCVEHATGLDSELIPTFAKRGIAIVPTLIQIAHFPDNAAKGEAKYPVYAAHVRRLYERRYDTVANAYDAGVPIFVGTDAGSTISHGMIAHEVAELVRAGIPPTSAVDAACWGARSWLGAPALEEGASADLVVYDTDPRQDVTALHHPTLRLLRGKAAG